MRKYLLMSAALIVLATNRSPSLSLGISTAAGPWREESFSDPIDALSVEFPTPNDHQIAAEVSGFDGKTWTSWEILTPDDEEDPLARESNLVMFPRPVSRIRLRGSTDVALHPIRVSHEPAHYTMAARMEVMKPRVLSRDGWGADPSLLYANTSNSSGGDVSDTREPEGNGSSAPVSSRIQDCKQAQELYPGEFRIADRATTDAEGHKFLWPQEYSPSVRLLVVHHTAGTVSTDSRPPVERMRALYAYHAKTHGWGDIGYHYVIDETGQIYQGRAGGEAVIGGHAYCNNIGTVGIALMGNFEVEQPTQAQIQSLQWLASTLAQQYGIDLNRNVIFHGKNLPPIVGHRDLLSTSCPGYALTGVMDQIRSHARTGLLAANVTFPPPRTSSSSSRSSAAPLPRHVVVQQGLVAMGSTALTGRPGGEVFVALQYRTSEPVRRGQSLGVIKRSSTSIGVWVVGGEAYARARAALLAPAAMEAGTVTTLRVRIQIPRDRGTHTVSFGPVTYTITTEGHRLPALPRGSTAPQQTTSPSTPIRSTRPSSSAAMGDDYPVSFYSSSMANTSSVSPSSFVLSPSSSIRIRLTDTRDTPPDTIEILLSGPALINSSSMNGGNITFTKRGENCTASRYGTDLTTGVVRMDPQGGISTVTSMVKTQNRYRGILECRVVDGTLTLINELPLEDYIAGLAEEPDGEPFQKQKAFAVAARTYATYYLDPSHRKFPGKPYDGSDSPAEFQMYGGAVFEESNPRWIQAVRETAGDVLMKNNQVLRAPYFSSDDGRTRSPAEAGWPNFPFPEVFVTKPDPWCQGMTLSGHGVGMSGCGARGQAYEGKSFAEILQYYYPGTTIEGLKT